MMKEQVKVELTAVQLQAVLQYAAERGLAWKASLSADWLRSAARTRSGGDEYRAALQQVRNLAGPRWLSRVTVAELQQQLAAQAPSGVCAHCGEPAAAVVAGTPMCATAQGGQACCTAPCAACEAARRAFFAARGAS